MRVATLAESVTVSAEVARLAYEPPSTVIVSDPSPPSSKSGVETDVIFAVIASAPAAASIVRSMPGFLNVSGLNVAGVPVLAIVTWPAAGLVSVIASAPSVATNVSRAVVDVSVTDSMSAWMTRLASVPASVTLSVPSPPFRISVVATFSVPDSVSESLPPAASIVSDPSGTSMVTVPEPSPVPPSTSLPPDAASVSVSAAAVAVTMTFCGLSIPV